MTDSQQPMTAPMSASDSAKFESGEIGGWRRRVVPFWIMFGTMLMRMGFQLKVRGGTHVPRSGGAIIAANHPTYLDPPMIYGAVHRVCRRQVHFMAADFLFKLPVIGPWMRPFGAFPVSLDRAEISSFRQAVRHLEMGQLVGIFPEGGRSPSPNMMPKLKTGVIRVAWKTGLPIIPATIIGGFRTWPIYRGWRFPRFKRTEIIFHPPFIPERPPGMKTEFIESGEGFKKARPATRQQSVEFAMQEMEKLREIIEAPLRAWFRENRPKFREPDDFLDAEPFLPRPRVGSEPPRDLPDLFRQFHPTDDRIQPRDP